MRRNILLTLFGILISLIMVFGIVFLNDPTMFVSKKEDTTGISYDVFYCTVETGSLTRSYSTQARVISGKPELYLNSFDISVSASDHFECNVVPGDELNTGDTLYVKNGEACIVNTGCKVVSVSDNELSGEKIVLISILDYSKLYAVAYVDLAEMSKISYNTKTIISFDGDNYEARIKEIGYEVSNNSLPVMISATCRVLPGMVVDVTFVSEKKVEGMFVLESAVSIENGGAYVIRKNDSSRERVRVEIGETFSETDENGITRNYRVILSGVNPGDTIIVESVG